MIVRKKKQRLCVVCGFNSSQGTSYDGRFVCTACERERMDEEERRYDDAEFAESERQECRVVRRF